jgi:hypothetical protein
MEVKTALGNKDVSLIEVTPDNYIVPKGEEHLFHAVIEVQKFDANTGRRQSTPRVQKFGKKSFESGGVRDNLKRQGYSLLILHDPNAWLEQNKKLTEEQQAENNRIQLQEQQERAEKLRIEKEEADQKKIDDAVAKALESQQSAIQKAIDEGIRKGLAAQAKATPAKTTETPTAKATGTTETTKTGDAAKTTGTPNTK